MATNSALLNKIADRIESDPAHFDLGFFAAPAKDVDPIPAKWDSGWKDYDYGDGDTRTHPRRIVADVPLPTCGTVACVAGWTIIETDPKLRRRRRIGLADIEESAERRFGTSWVSEAAMGLLGLRSADIFYPLDWRERGAGRPTAKNVAKQLRLLAKGKGKFADAYVAPRGS